MSRNFKKFLLLWIGEFISSIGGGLTSFGLGVYIFNQTGSAASMGVVTLLGFLPTLLLGVPAGVLADRYDRRLLMMIGDGLSAIGVIYILVSMWMQEVTLWQICIGVMISSVFSALLEPSYKATITDLLTKEEFSKASGLVSLAGSARYLLSPMIAGLLLSIGDVKWLLIIDICTFFLTVFAAAVVRRGIPSNVSQEPQNFFKSLKDGWTVVRSRRSVLALVFASSFLTLFMGVFQILVEPFVLSFSNAQTLGVTESICASGMLATAVFLGVKGIKKEYIKALKISLGLAGLFMAIVGFSWQIELLCFFGFLFFSTLPVANNCLDYLIRINIPQDVQGRAWGIIGFISQMGYVVAYATAGLVADILGTLTGKGVGSGAAIGIIISGILLMFFSMWLFSQKDIKKLEDEEMTSVLGK